MAQHQPHPPAHPPGDPRSLTREVRFVTFAGLLVNLVLSAFKFVGGILGNSEAAVADAVHSLSDSATDVAILVGVRYWTAPADDDHPYGHHRIETLVTLSIGLVLLGVAGGLFYQAILSLHDPEPKDVGWIALVVTGASVLSKEALYRWTVHEGTRLRSSAMVANAWHHRSDAFSSIPAFLSILGVLIEPSLWFLDPLGAILVVMFIGRAAWSIISEALAGLTDKSATQGTCRAVEVASLGTLGVKSIHKVRTRRIGPGVFVDLHIQVDPELTVREGHDISRAVKARVLEMDRDILDVLVHLEPFDGG